MNQGPATTILVLVGSLRRGSINRQIAQAAIDQAPNPVRMRLFDGLGELPLYNEDVDTGDVVEPVAAFRAAAAEADALLVVTPEYNGSIPGGLKNEIDWLSRPYGRGPMSGKPAAVIGASLSRYGGVWAHDEARKSLGIAGLRIVESIRLSVPTRMLKGKHPAEDADLVRTLRGIVEDLAAEVSA